MSYRPALDKSRAERHEQCVVSRSLWLLVLLSAFLVAGARCLSGFIGLSAGTPDGTVSASQGSSAPTNGDDFTNGASADDDSDDSADALMAPASFEADVVRGPALELLKLSFAGEELTLSSHARGLDRPPRV